MKIIGITGGIGAGKSAVLDAIKNKLNCFILLSDEAAHEVKKYGHKCYYELIELLGEDILDDNLEINKSKMANKIFMNSTFLEKANNIIHPAVKEYILDEIQRCENLNQYDFFFVEAALLIECGYKEIVDEMWYVYADEAIRRKRLKDARGYSDEKIDSIMLSQLNDNDFRKNSDFVIDNSYTVEESVRQILQRIGQ